MKALLLSIALTGSLLAASPPDGPCPQVAMIRTGGASGTATIIGKVKGYGFWITAFHVVGNSQNVTVDNTRQKWDGKVIAYDKTADVSIVITGGEKVPSPMRVWTGSLAKSLEYYSEGYAGGTPTYFGRRKGSVISTYGKRANWSFPSMAGDSGGPIYVPFKDKVYLIGITATSNRAHTHPSSNIDGETGGANPQAIRALLVQAGLKVSPTGVVVYGDQVMGGRGWIFPLRKNGGRGFT